MQGPKTNTVIAYHHTLSLEFSLISVHDENTITSSELKRALLDRVREIDQENDWLDACDGPYDSYEVETMTIMLPNAPQGVWDDDGYFVMDNGEAFNLNGLGDAFNGVLQERHTLREGLKKILSQGLLSDRCSDEYLDDDFTLADLGDELRQLLRESEAA